MAQAELLKPETLDLVLDTAAREEQTGMLRIRANGTEVRAYLIDGSVVGAATDDQAFDLRRFLLAAGLIKDHELEACERLMARTGAALDDVLLSTGVVDPVVLERIRGTHATELLLGLDLFEDAECSFEPDVLPEEVSGDLSIESGKLLEERQRRAERTEQLRPMVKRLEEIVQRVAQEATPVGQDEKSVWELIDGKRPLKELCVLSGLGRWRTLSAVGGMNERGVVKLGSAIPGDDLDTWFDLDSRWEEVFCDSAPEPAAEAQSQPASEVPMPAAEMSPVLEGDLMAGDSEDAGIDAERWMRVGREQMEAGRYQDSMESFQRALQEQPDNPQILMVVSEARRRLCDALVEIEFPIGSSWKVNTNTNGNSRALEREEVGLLHELAQQPDVHAMLMSTQCDELETLLALKRLKDEGVVFEG